MAENQQGFDIARLPELATAVAIPGAMARAEVGGQGCGDTGVLVAIVIFNISEE